MSRAGFFTRIALGALVGVVLTSLLQQPRTFAAQSPGQGVLQPVRGS